MNVGNGLDRSADNHRTYYPNVGRGRAPAANKQQKPPQQPLRGFFVSKE